MDNNIVNTLYADNGYQTNCGDHFIMYVNVKSLCNTPETNIILYINYISIKNKVHKILLLTIQLNVFIDPGHKGENKAHHEKQI